MPIERLDTRVFPGLARYGQRYFAVSLGFVLGSVMLQGPGSLLYQTLARPADSPHETFYIVFPYVIIALGGLASNVFFGKFVLIGYITTG